MCLSTWSPVCLTVINNHKHQCLETVAGHIWLPKFSVFDHTGHFGTRRLRHGQRLKMYLDNWSISSFMARCVCYLATSTTVAHKRCAVDFRCWVELSLWSPGGVNASEGGIIRLEKVVKSTIWYSLKNKGWTGDLNNVKRAGRQQKKWTDGRICAEQGLK